MMNVSAGQPKLAFETYRRQHLSRDDQLFQIRRVIGQSVDDDVAKFFAPRIPIAILYLVWSKLCVNRHHVRAAWRKRWIGERWNRDIQVRPRRDVAIFRRVEGPFEVINVRTKVNAARKFLDTVIIRALQTNELRQ